MFTVGVFQDTTWADRGVAALLADGFSADSLSILGKPSTELDALVRSHIATPIIEIAVKGLGSVSAAGSLVETLQGPDEGLSSGGLAATIRRAGFQAHDGFIFQRLVDRGGILVAIESEARAADALALLHSYGGGNAAIGAWQGRV